MRSLVGMVLGLFDVGHMTSGVLGMGAFFEDDRNQMRWSYH